MLFAKATIQSDFRPLRSACKGRSMLGETFACFYLRYGDTHCLLTLPECSETPGSLLLVRKSTILDDLPPLWICQHCQTPWNRTPILHRHGVHLSSCDGVAHTGIVIHSFTPKRILITWCQEINTDLAMKTQNEMQRRRLN